MAEPPRLPAIRLSWENSIIYFVTICVKDRREVLAATEVFEAIKTAIPELQKWHVLAFVIMAEHAHWLVSPVEDRELSVGDFSHAFKRTLRSDENLWSRWIYVKNNPVRHGLVQNADEWPYYFDFINQSFDGGSCQLPLQLKGVGGR